MKHMTTKLLTLHGEVAIVSVRGPVVMAEDSEWFRSILSGLVGSDYGRIIVDVSGCSEHDRALIRSIADTYLVPSGTHLHVALLGDTHPSRRHNQTKRRKIKQSATAPSPLRRASSAWGALNKRAAVGVLVVILAVMLWLSGQSDLAKAILHVGLDEPSVAAPVIRFKGR